MGAGGAEDARWIGMGRDRERKGGVDGKYDGV